MVVRELIARLGIQFDGKSARKAEQKTKGVLGNIQKATMLMGAAALGLGLAKVTKLASDTVENLNILNQAFGDNRQDVQNWATTFAEAAGRSKYGMEAMAGTLGAVLNPLLDDNKDLSAEAAKNLSQLAVDLGSFYNVADSQAVNALRAGLTGETEPLKRLGIVMTEVALKAYMLEQGITADYHSMGIAAKTELRYNFLMAKTAMVQGDAARTSMEYANSSKAFKTALVDVATVVGLKLLPGMRWLMNVMKQGAMTFRKAAEHSKILEASLLVLGAIVVALGVKLWIAFAPVIVPIALLAAKLALIVLLVDDFLTFLDGGDSIIGRFIDTIFGPGSATAAVKALHEAWQGLKILWIQDIKPVFEMLQELFEGAIKFWVEDGIPAISKFFDYLGTKINWALDKVQAFFDFISGGWKAASEFLGFDTGEKGMKKKAPTLPKLKEFGSRSEMLNNFNTNVNVNVSGKTDKNTANQIGRVAGKHVANSNKASLRALTQRAPA